MQATNKSDATQVYENTVRASKVGIKDTFKYLLKPLTIFSYHYFVEGIRAVQLDGPTKELSKRWYKSCSNRTKPIYSK